MMQGAPKKGWYSGLSTRTGLRGVQRTHGCAVDERGASRSTVWEAYDRMMSGKARFRVVLTMRR